MTPNRSAWLVVAAAVLWGTTGTAQALGEAAGSPLSVGAIRLLIGAGGLLALAWRKLRVPPPGWLAISSVAMATYQISFFTGVARTGVALGTVIAIGTAPIFAGLLAWVVRGERPTSRWVMATALAVAGVLLVVGRPDDADLIGVGAAVGAGLSYAVYALGSKHLVERIDPTAAMAVAFSVAAVILLPFLLSADVTWLSTPRGLSAALWLGLVATTGSYVLFARGLRGVPVGHAATLSLAEPATAALAGVAVLGERPTLAGWLGIGVVAGAVVLLGTGRVSRSLTHQP